MQQRVAIARAVAFRPEILLLDEPFASVDALTRADLEDLTLALRDEFGITMLLVTHDIDEAVYLSDRVFVLSAPPSAVLEEIAIPLAQPRDQVRTRSEPGFLELRNHIHGLIGKRHEDGKPAFTASEAWCRSSNSRAIRFPEVANENGNAEGKRPSYHEQKNRVFVRPIAGEYNLTQELKRLRSLPRVLKGRETPFHSGPQQFSKHYLEPKDGLGQTLHIHLEEYSPGGKSQKHGHVNEAVFYILDGEGAEDARRRALRVGSRRRRDRAQQLRAPALQPQSRPAGARARDEDEADVRLHEHALSADDREDAERTDADAGRFPAARRAAARLGPPFDRLRAGSPRPRSRSSAHEHEPA